MEMILFLFAIVIIGVVYIYNRLITLKNRAVESLSDIDVQLKRRYDLIPNLVETVKGYAQHEKQVFEQVVKLRTEAMQMKGEMSGEKMKIENDISTTLKSLFAVAENYPDLKANQNFLELQRDVKDTEDKLQAARRFYNTNVMVYNTAQQVFPNSLFSGIFGHTTMKFFEVETVSEKNPVHVTL